MMRRLTSAPKPSWRVRVYIADQVAVAVDAQAVAHAVEAREVRRRLGRGEDVVGAERVRARAAGGTSRRSRRAPRRACSVASNAARTPGSMPSPRQLLRHAEADAVEALGASAAATGSGSPSDVESRVVAGRPCGEQQRGVGDVARQRAGLVERGGEGDHPVAARPRRTSASGRRSRTARRAGGSSRRCRCRAPTARARRRRRRRCRRSSRRGRALRSHGFSTGPKAEFSFDEPIANSSWLVLPSSGAPAACAGARRRSPCTAAGSPRGSSSPPGSGRPRCRTGP